MLYRLECNKKKILSTQVDNYKFKSFKNLLARRPYLNLGLWNSEVRKHFQRDYKFMIRPGLLSENSCPISSIIFLKAYIDCFRVWKLWSSFVVRKIHGLRPFFLYITICILSSIYSLCTWDSWHYSVYWTALIKWDDRLRWIFGLTKQKIGKTIAVQGCFKRLYIWR